MTAPRKFLVTGATTPLGRAVSARLERSGEVFGVRTPDEPREVGARMQVADLGHSPDVRAVVAGLIGEAGIDTVVHLGGPKHALSTRLFLDGLGHASSVRAFVLRSSALIYRLRPDDALVIHEHHPLDLAPDLGPQQRDTLEADLTACQRSLDASFSVSVLRLAPLIAAQTSDALGDCLQRGQPCYRAMGFDPMLNVLSLDDAAEAFARAAQLAPRGVFNIAGADTLPLSVLAARVGVTCRPVPGALIEPLCALRRGHRPNYRALRHVLRHGLVVDGRAAARAFGFVPCHPVHA